jgi:hypothetical protein
MPGSHKKRPFYASQYYGEIILVFLELFHSGCQLTVHLENTSVLKRKNTEIQLLQLIFLLRSVRKKSSWMQFSLVLKYASSSEDHTNIFLGDFQVQFFLL